MNFEDNERTRTSLRSTSSGLSHQAESLEQAMKRRGKLNTIECSFQHLYLDGSL